MSFLLSFVLLICGCDATSYNSTVACHASTNLTTAPLAIVRLTQTIARGSNFTGDSTEMGYNTPQTNLPDACRVALKIGTSTDSSARFEL